MIVEFNETGQIFHILHDPVPAGVPEAMTEAGRPFIELLASEVDGVRIEPTVSFFTDYVKDGKITARPTVSVPHSIELAVGEDASIDGLPIPCAILFDGEAMTVEDGSLEVSADMPGEYTIRFVQWPYVEAETKVIIHEA